MNRTWVVSDVHLGSRFCRCAAFMDFIGGLPAGDALVLNGDIVDQLHGTHMAEHAPALELLRTTSRERQVLWINGNNDRHYRLPDAPGIRYADREVLEGRCLICHGDRFEPGFRRNPLLFVPARMMYWAYRRLTDREIHAAAFAKLLRRAYRAFTNHVARSACSDAANRGLTIAICGHTHLVEDRVIGTVRYINTGCWTEDTVRAAAVCPETVSLIALGDSEGLKPC